MNQSKSQHTQRKANIAAKMATKRKDGKGKDRVKASRARAAMRSV